MSAFKVGDVVEVILSRTPEHVGRQLVVVNPASRAWCSGNGGYPRGYYIGVRCAPALFNREHREIHWHPQSLRKINPPDWSAPVTTDEELEA